MKTIKTLVIAFCTLLAVSVFAADKLAVAEPVGKGGVKAEDIEAFWGILESSFQSGEYKLISRGALKQMMTEIGLTASSDLVNLNSAQKAKLGQLEGVKYILVSEVGKFGTRINCTLKILDASTGEIDQMRTANLRVKDLDELADKIEATMMQLLADDKQLPTSALLNPVIRSAGAPAYLADDFNIQLESGLINAGMPMQNLKSVRKILQKNNLDRLDELEPKMFVKVGKLLEVQQIIRATVTRFEIIGIPYQVSETGAQGTYYIATTEGFVRAVSARTGLVLASVPFEIKIDSRSLDRALLRSWTMDDYGKYLIKVAVHSQIVPMLQKTPAFAK